MSNVKTNCLDIIKGNDALEKHFEGITDLSDVKQREEAIELAKSYYETLHKELEGFKKSINKEYKPKKFVPEDTSAKVAAIKEKYAAEAQKKAAAEPKEEPKVSIPEQGGAKGTAAVPKLGDKVKVKSKL